jgi:hypothetical protein
MERMETQDPEKKRLQETSDHHRRELEKEVNSLTEKTERMLTNALIIGGSLALTYFVVSRFTGSKVKKKKARAKAIATEEDEETGQESPVMPSLISQIGQKVISQASMILLDMAREKLNEYLQARKESHENS